MIVWLEGESKKDISNFRNPLTIMLEESFNTDYEKPLTLSLRNLTDRWRKQIKLSTSSTERLKLKKTE
jgi:hypothetical protein